jgi:hypothetical protein
VGVAVVAPIEAGSSLTLSPTAAARVANVADLSFFRLPSLLEDPADFFFFFFGSSYAQPGMNESTCESQ